MTTSPSPILDLRPLHPHLGPFLIVLSRLTGLFIFAPVLSSPVIPTRVKVYLALALASAAYVTLLPSLQARSEVPLNWTLWHLLPGMGVELLIGLVVGFLAALPLTSLQLGGMVIGQQMGLGLAQVYNPAVDDQGDLVGQLLFYLALTAFVFVGGIEAMLTTVLNSFINVPAGGYRVDVGLVDLCVGMLTSSVELAMRVAAPVLCIIFLETFAMGFMNKTAPAFNILSLGFPIKILLGLLVMAGAMELMGATTFDHVVEGVEAFVAYMAAR